MAGPGGNSTQELDRSDPERMSTARAAAALKIHGADYNEIARVMDYADASQARKAVETALGALAGPENAAATRNLIQARLEASIKSLAPKALNAKIRKKVGDKEELVDNPDHLAYNREFRGNLEALARLTGANAPQVLSVITPDAKRFEETVQAVVAAASGAELAESGDIWATEENEDGVYEPVEATNE